jgi:protein TonB
MTALARQSFLADRQDRALAFAVVGSLLIHVALLLLLPLLREAQQRNEAEKPIVARLVEPPIRPPPPSSEAEPLAEARKPSMEASPPAPVRTTPRLQPASKRASAVPLARDAPRVDTLPAIEAHAAGSTSTSIPPSPNSASAPASDVPDAGTLAQYRLALMSAARSYKAYPRFAIENSWQGKVEVRMAIGVDGSIVGLSVLSSTGHALLDRQALDMIERAKAAAQVPPALRGRQFAVDIPVEFAFREPGA